MSVKSARDIERRINAQLEDTVHRVTVEYLGDRVYKVRLFRQHRCVVADYDSEMTLDEYMAQVLQHNIGVKYRFPGRPPGPGKPTGARLP